MGTDLLYGPLMVTQPADGAQELLPEELAVRGVDVVPGVLLGEPDPGALVVPAVEADDRGEVGEAWGDDSILYHVAHVVNTPHMFPDAVQVH